MVALCMKCSKHRIIFSKAGLIAMQGNSRTFVDRSIFQEKLSVILTGPSISLFSDKTWPHGCTLHYHCALCHMEIKSQHDESPQADDHSGGETVKY